MKRIFNFLGVLLIAAAACRADIVITFDQANQSGSQGGILNFFATLQNTGATAVDLSTAGDQLNFTGSFGELTDNFFSNVPLSVGGNQSASGIDLFDIALTDAPGTYTGSYVLQDGSGTTLATADFSVTINGAQTVPEPSAVFLMALILAALVMVRSNAKSRLLFPARWRR